MGSVHLILFLLAISVEGILADSPCGKTFNGSDTVHPEDIPTNVTTCTFNFVIDPKPETLMLVFSSLSSGVTITINAVLPPNISTVITNITSGNDPVTVVSTSALTIVTFQRTNGSQGTFKLIYKNVCEQEVDPLSGFLSSPKYLPFTNKTVMCKYNVMSPEGQITLFEFADFTFKSGSLAVAGTNVTVAAGKKLPDDLLIPSNTTIVLNILNTEKTVEGFSSILSLVSSECSSKAFNISNPFSYKSNSGAVCHLMIDGSNGTLVATVKSWQTDLSDQLQFQDGFSQEDSLLNSGSSVQANIMLVSSGPKMSVHLVFGRTIKQRSVEISFTSQVYGKLVKVGDNIMYESAKAGGKDGVFQCTLDAGKKVSLTNFNMIYNGTVEVYDGNLIIGTPLFTITGTSLSIPIFMKSNQMTIVTKSAANYTFNAIAGEARAGDQFSQPELGSYAVYAVGPNDTYTYNLIILPMPKEEYRGTLQLTSLALICPGDKVTIFEDITTINASKKLVEFTDNSTYQFIPQYIFGANKGARIVTALSKCDKRKAGDVVLTASYDMKTLVSLCGEKPSSPRGRVTSPYFPLRYPLNLNCQWTFENKTDSFMYISVDKLNITDGSSLKLTGNITEFDFTADKTLGRDLIFSKSKDLMLSFNSQSQDGTLVIPGEGFVVSYEYLDCGGSTTVNINVTLGGAKKDCRWIIGLPKTTQDSVMSGKDVYIINATLKVAEGYVAGSLIVYDGTNMKDVHRVNLTNLTVGHELPFQSRVDTFIIQYVNNNTTAKEFPLTVNIAKYLCTTLCQNGICMHVDWVCNNVNDCGDNSDELYCNGTVPVQPTTPSPPQPKPAPQPDKGEVPGFWLAIMLIIGLIIGILLPFIIPAIVRRMRKRSYNRMTDMGNPEA